MPMPIPFADDGGTPDWGARPASPPAPRFPIWRFFLLALTALPLLLKFVAAASWLARMCFEGVMEPPGAVIALTGIAAALAALIRRHTGMTLGAALSLVALVGLAGLVWVVFAWLAVALVAGCDGTRHYTSCLMSAGAIG